jgi:hypothetical protein
MPIEFASRGETGVRPGPRCGATGPTALVAAEATCPACRALANITTIRTGVERAQRSVGTVVMDLCVWEGRGDWAALPADHRRASGLQGLEHLGEAITELEARRAELRAALGLKYADRQQALEQVQETVGGLLAPHAADRADDDQRSAELVHYTTSTRAVVACGADWGDGTVSPYTDDVTCPQCTTRLAT